MVHGARAQLGRRRRAGRCVAQRHLLRPRARPASLIAAPEPDAAAIEAALGEATEQAVAASLKPRLRPQSLVRAVPRQQPQADSASDDGEPELTRTAAAAPRIPTSASIAQQATTRNAINLRQVNLIGVYGTPSDRRALVRLANGRYQKVQVGDRIDGGPLNRPGKRSAEARAQDNERRDGRPRGPSTDAKADREWLGLLRHPSGTWGPRLWTERRPGNLRLL